MSDVRLIPRESAVMASQHARREFEERLRVGGLTVTVEAAGKWWPMAAETKPFDALEECGHEYEGDICLGCGKYCDD